MPSSFTEKLSRQVWITKGARFNAHRRLSELHEWSVRAVALLSVYVIILTLAVGTSAFGMTQGEQARASFLATALSILILALSLLESSRNYQLRAHQLHECGRQLVALENKIELLRGSAPSATAPNEELQRLSDEYNAILSSCPENHTPLDDSLFRASHRAAFGINTVNAIRLRLFGWLRTFGWYALLVGGPPILLVRWLV